MFYKVLKNGKVIDVLDRLAFVRYQKKHGIMLFCKEEEAQAICASSSEQFWHLPWLLSIPDGVCDTVDIEEIDEYEYRQLRILNMKTPEEIIDAYTLFLIDGGVL